VNEAGQVVGMITAGARNPSLQQTSAVGFAIPVNRAVGVANEMRAGHASSRILLGQTGFLGVEVRTLDSATAAQLGLDVSSGALVAGVISGTPADRAGIAGGAVITAVGGQKIESADQLGPKIYTHKPGEQIKVTWVDQKGTHTATVTLIAGPAV
jgi:S1-C subfamily serine protease